MALCLAVLGLRASEVADLRLASIDWRAGTLTVAPNKTGRGRVLPLPPRVGRAIVAYLHLRPRSTSERRVSRRPSPSLVSGCSGRCSRRCARRIRSRTSTGRCGVSVGT
ncbi:MAG: tyrosine-type recombinase/integrase [Candidatus Polarisedimenticolia bacterium]